VRYTYDASPVSSPLPPVTLAYFVVVPFWIYGLGDGREAKTDSGRPKDLARSARGVLTSQSARLNVVLRTLSATFQRWGEVKVT
jgi:hypothetical protein